MVAGFGLGDSLNRRQQCLPGSLIKGSSRLLGHHYGFLYLFHVLSLLLLLVLSSQTLSELLLDHLPSRFHCLFLLQFMFYFWLLPFLCFAVTFSCMLPSCPYFHMFYFFWFVCWLHHLYWLSFFKLLYCPAFLWRPAVPRLNLYAYWLQHYCWLSLYKPLCCPILLWRLVVPSYNLQVFSSLYSLAVDCSSIIFVGICYNLSCNSQSLALNFVVNLFKFKLLWFYLRFYVLFFVLAMDAISLSLILDITA